MMKPKIKRLCSFIAILFFIVYACNKKDIQPTSADKYAPYKEWIHAHAGTYSNEIIAVQTNKGDVITGSLKWNQLTRLVFEGKNYVFIPFSFQFKGKHFSNIPLDSANKIPEASFSLVLRENSANQYDIALNTKLFAVPFSEDATINNGTVENYYAVSGDWMNSWFYNNSNGSPQKIFKESGKYKTAPKNNGAVTDLTAQSPCVDVPVTTYETECWSDGGPYNGTTCTSVPVTTYYTVFDDSGGGGGDGGTTGGGYPPTGGGGGSPPPPPPPPPPDPCTVAQPAATNATNVSKTSGYSSGLTAVKNAAKDGNEHAVSLNKNSSGVISSTPVSNGGETNSSTSLTNSTVATIHNHPDNTPPSAGDVYYLISGNKSYTSFTTKYVTLPDGNVYALVITNRTAASSFAAKYPMTQLPGYSPDFPVGDGNVNGNNDPLDNFSNCWSSLQSQGMSSEQANAMAMALVLDKYNAGVALLKQNSDGNFSKLGTTQTGTGSSATYTQNNCPNLIQ